MAMPTKQELRKEMLCLRSAIPASVRKTKSKEICRELWRLAQSSDARTVAVYAAMRSEVDLLPFIRRAYEQGMRVTFPAMLATETDGQRMQMRAVTERDFSTGSAPFISKPTHAFTCGTEQQNRFPLVDPCAIDLIAVPLVAFEIHGHRLGYGGGCYDRYLPQLSATCAVVGVAFDEQRVPTLPQSAYDIPLPRIISA